MLRAPGKETIMSCSTMRTLAWAVVVAMSIAFAGCSDSTHHANDNEAALLSVSPQGGSTDVDPKAQIRLEFHHPIEDGMEQFCAVHLGGVDGDKVPGTWEWSDEHHVLTFTPHEPFQHDREHTIHVGDGIIDVHGHGMDFDQHGHDMGGHWIEEDMLGYHEGMMGDHPHMGDGWQHHNGTYGMAFPFWTAP